ncbi:hypothetical protein [Roseateles noduli]|uniref:hypothetical protein n=1 Tax=Roseateles noduli TaxID=2052484 RepID=UPI003D65E2B2
MKIVELAIQASASIGTAAAAALALYFGLSGHRREDARHRALAVFAAAKLGSRLDTISAKIVEIDVGMMFASREEKSHVLQVEFLKAFPDSVMALPESDLIGLLGLPNNAAPRLIRAIEGLKALRDEIAHRRASLYTLVVMPEATTLDRWEREFDGNMKLFVVAYREIDALVRQGAAPPSGQELYGDE